MRRLFELFSLLFSCRYFNSVFFSLFRCFVTDYNLIPPAFFICGTFGVSPGRQVLWVMSAESCASWALPWQIRKNSNKNQGTLEKSAEK